MERKIKARHRKKSMKRKMLMTMYNGITGDKEKKRGEKNSAKTHERKTKTWQGSDSQNDKT